MQKRELIISLIQQDIKHNMLMNGLYNLGLNDNQEYVLDIVSIVAEMMGIENGMVTDEWLDKYHSTMLSVLPVMTFKEQISEAEKLFESLSNIE